MSFGLFAVGFVGSVAGVWLVSQITEALRPVPQTPKTLRWAPEIPIGYVDIGGCKLRYIKTGRGPNLVLLHTLRTQLDLFEKVVPEHFNRERLVTPMILEGFVKGGISRLFIAGSELADDETFRRGRGW